MYRINSTLLKQLSVRVASRYRGAAGDRTSVGLFLRVPDELIGQYPPASKEDTSPRHVTFLYVGAVPADREELFLEVLRGALEGWGTVDAAFDGVDFFVHPEKDRRVFYSRVKFDRDMGSLRDRVRHLLGEFGFDVADSFPLAYNAHSTLDYVEGLDTPYEGPVPSGDWVVRAVEVWGLPSEHVIELGDQNLVNTRLAEMPSDDVWVDWADQLPGGLADDMTPADFDPIQLEKGTEVEMEHVDEPDRNLATEIAMDHLMEEASYYDLLEEVEKKAYSLANEMERGFSIEKKAGHDPDVVWDLVNENLAANPNHYRD